MSVNTATSHDSDLDLAPFCAECYLGLWRSDTGITVVEFITDVEISKNLPQSWELPL